MLRNTTRRASKTTETTHYYLVEKKYKIKKSIGRRGGTQIHLTDLDDDVVFKYISYHMKGKTKSFRCNNRKCLARVKINKKDEISLFGVHTCDEIYKDTSSKSLFSYGKNINPIHTGEYSHMRQLNHSQNYDGEIDYRQTSTMDDDYLLCNYPFLYSGNRPTYYIFDESNKTLV